MTPLVLLLLAQAQVFVWTDKQGVEHYTDDPALVPLGVKVRLTDGTEISRISNDTPPRKEPQRPTTPSPAAGAPVLARPGEPAVPSVSEETWRRLFREARNRIRTLEEDIEADRKQLEEVNGLPVTARYSCQNVYTVGPPPVVVVNGVSVTSQPVPGVVVSGSVGAVNTWGQLPMTSCAWLPNPEVDRVRERLEKNRRELPRAREDLADLERRASFEAVPLHWRR